MNDQNDPNIEAQIRRALEARAEETTMSPDARESIRSRSNSRWARPAIYGAVAAVLVLIAGVALLNRPDDDAGPVDSAGTTTEAPTFPSTTTSPTEPDTTASTTLPDTGDPAVNQNGLREPLPSSTADVVAAGLELWRDDSITDPTELATAYATTQLGIVDPSLSDLILVTEGVSTGDERAFGVHRRGEDGEVLDSFAFKIAVHTDERGPAVTHVLSDAFRIDTVEENTADTIRVTGAGVAFEGTALLRIDGAETLLSVGGVEMQEFSVIVPRPAGDGAITVVIEGTTVFADEVPELAAYRTVPIPRTTTLSVFGVAEDDVLNVRSGPGVENDIVFSLAPDAGGIAVTGATSDETDEWWEIETADGVGWVNSRYVVVNRNLERSQGLDEKLLGILESGVPTLEPFALAEQLEFGGIGVYADFPTPWANVARDDLELERNWSPDGLDDRTCDCDLTVAEFLGFDTAKWDLAEFTIGTDLEPDDPNHFFSAGQTPEFFDRFTTGTIFIPEPNPDVSLDWRRYTVVFDFENGRPLVKGIWRWGWTP